MNLAASISVPISIHNDNRQSHLEDTVYEVLVQEKEMVNWVAEGFFANKVSQVQEAFDMDLDNHFQV